MRQSPLSVEAKPAQPDTPLRLEITMSRITLLCSLAALLMVSACANASKNADQTSWAQSRLACAEVGIDPGSPAFGQCVLDLYYSVWNEQKETDN
jgi:hypothetical protein